MFGGNHTRTTTRRALRTGIATLGASMALFAYSGAAVAAPGGDAPSKDAPADAVTGVPSAHSVGAIPDKDNKGTLIPVSLFDLELSTGKTVVTYCIDLHHELANGKTYVEGNWDKANPQSDMPRILWTLDHSGPLLPAADVLTAAGAPPIGDDQRAADIVYMATQAAVWHFSDGFNLGTDNPTFGGNHVPAVPDEALAIQKVYAFLTGSANTGESEPAPALSITPDSLSGQVGKAIGPFTVNTTAKTISLTPSSGAKLVDSDGKPVDSAADGGTFSVLLDKPGDATVQATGSGTVPVGRIFVFQKSPDTAQKLVVATPAPMQVSAKVTVTVTAAAVSPTASPSPRPAPVLASTGASPWPKVGLGVLLLALGTGLTLLARRRRTS